MSSSSSSCSKPTTKGIKGAVVPKGFVPLLLYSLAFCAIPLVTYFGGERGLARTSMGAQVATVVGSALVALVVLCANDCVVWFNLVLFFHLGIEIIVTDKVVDYALLADTPTEGKVLGWVAVAVIGTHLLPFFLVDHRGLLAMLAAAGVVVNAAALAYVAPGETGSGEDLVSGDSYLLLLTGFSSTVLLGCVLMINYIDCAGTSMLSQLKQACAEGTWFVCTPYEM